MWVFGRPWSRWRTARLLLILLWIFALLAWGFTTLVFALRFFEAISSIVLVVVLWPWVRGPYLLYKRGRLPRHARYAVQPTPPEAFNFFSSDLKALAGLGFEFAGVLTKESTPIRPSLPLASRPQVQLAMYIHPTNKDSAQVARVGSLSREIHTLVFKTRFDDGFAFETSSSFTAPVFPPDPEFPVFRFAPLRYRPDLYRIHQKLKERFSTTRRAVIGDRSTELAEFVARAEKVHQRIAATDYKLSEAGDRYVFTARGAIRRAWLRTWPVDLIRQMRTQRKAMKTAEEFGLRINPKLGRLEDSVRSVVAPTSRP